MDVARVGKALAGLPALLVFVAACARTTSPSAGGSQSNWLLCDVNRDCPEASCVCGVCLQSCQSVLDCSPGRRSTCVEGLAQVEAACYSPAAADEGLCVPECDTSDDCPHDDMTCVDGGCLPAPLVTATTTTTTTAPEPQEGQQTETDVDVCPGPGCPRDLDGDGVEAPEDCDDTDPRVSPGMQETCDSEGLDEDCNPDTVAGPDEPTSLADRDGDGYVGAQCTNATSDGSLVRGDDCDDLNPAISPGSTEIYDQLDNDCDGRVDEGQVSSSCHFEYLGDWVRCEEAGWPNNVDVQNASLGDCMAACLEMEECTAVTDWYWLMDGSELGCTLYVSTCDAPVATGTWEEEDAGKQYVKVCDGTPVPPLPPPTFGELRTLSDEELQAILAAHAQWVDDDTTGARADLSRTDLRGRDLSNATLPGADLSNANLEEANLEGAWLESGMSGVSLYRANLTGAQMILGDYTGAYLREAIMTDASLSDSDMRGAYFYGAKLDNAYFGTAQLDGADFSHADLVGAQGLTQAQLDTACGDLETRLPEGLTIEPCISPGIAR